MGRQGRARRRPPRSTDNLHTGGAGGPAGPGRQSKMGSSLGARGRRVGRLCLHQEGDAAVPGCRRGREGGWRGARCEPSRGRRPSRPQATLQLRCDCAPGLPARGTMARSQGGARPDPAGEPPPPRAAHGWPPSPHLILLSQMVVDSGAARWSSRLSIGPLSGVTWCCARKPAKATIARRPLRSSFSSRSRVFSADSLGGGAWGREGQWGNAARRGQPLPRLDTPSAVLCRAAQAPGFEPPACAGRPRTW
jgi:hypothetical protein